MQCKNCGNELEEGNNFCPKCGSQQAAEAVQAASVQGATETGESVSVESSKNTANEEYKKEVKNPVNWIFIFIGLAAQIMTSDFCCHFLNALWYLSVIGYLVIPVVISGIIAALIGKKGEDGKRKMSFQTFSIVLFILSIILVIGKFAKH